MFTRKALNSLLTCIHQELIQKGLEPTRIILFGSYAKGKVHAGSDIDVAVWSSQFSGGPMDDFEKVKSIAQKHRPVSFKLYPDYATSFNYDPFIAIIEQTGICIYEQEKQK